MYVILVYDVGVERVSKVCQFLRRYLNWIQNSVFEGELTNAEFTRIKEELKEMIDKDEDSIIVYILPNEKRLKKVVIGKEKGTIQNIF